MKIVILAGGPAQSFESLIKMDKNFDQAFYVGVDRGSFRLMQAGFPVNLAIGDFDSLSAEEFSAVSAYADEYHKSPTEKNDTDLELAVLAVLTRFQNIEEILILGGIGGRFDHQIQIFYLPLQSRFSTIVDKIILRDETNSIRFVSAGQYQLVKESQMTYLAFASLTPVKALAIQGAKYALAATDFDQNLSLSSNEFIDEQPVTLSFKKGMVAIIQSKDESK